LRDFAVRFSANTFRNVFPLSISINFLQSDFRQHLLKTDFVFNWFLKNVGRKMSLNLLLKLLLKSSSGKCGLTFRCYPTVANPANCVLSAKIMVLREKSGTTQEKPAIAD